MAWRLVMPRSWLLLVTVRGNSMTPTYEDGDRLLVWTWRHSKYLAGEVIVFRTPYHIGELTYLVKRVVACAGGPVPPEVAHRVGGSGREIPAGALVVRGDNPASLDSRHFGYVCTTAVVGRVLCRLARATRDGAGPRRRSGRER